jgi:methylmalonyl-CoA/ethylmalonyl-CoA epimerase
MDLRFSHADILVSDLDATIEYYRRVLGFKASEKHFWKRDDFHVEFVVMFKNSERLFFVHPIAGDLKRMLDEKGDGTIYRLCYTSPDVVACHRELKAKDVQPENERGEAVDESQLKSPGGTNILWMPKTVGSLSIEILEEEAFEKAMATLRETAS